MYVKVKESVHQHAADNRTLLILYVIVQAFPLVATLSPAIEHCSGSRCGCDSHNCQQDCHVEIITGKDSEPLFK